MRIHKKSIVCYSFFGTVVLIHMFSKYPITDDEATDEQKSKLGEKNNQFKVLEDDAFHFISRNIASNWTRSDPKRDMNIPDLIQKRNISETYIRGATEGLHKLHFGCHNLGDISIKRKIGQGVTKTVYLGIYNQKKMAVKMVTRNVIDVMSCLKTLRRDPLGDIVDRHKCYTLPNMKLMKEVLLLQQLHHPNLLKLTGYCVRSEETDSTSLQDHGIVATYEYGLQFYMSSLKEWPWRLRLRTAIELAELLDYFANSPLGSLSISDFKDTHFLLVNGRVKLIDLDDVTSLEPTCKPSRGTSEICGYNTQCVGGICVGYNARRNMDNFSKMFFSNLLFSDDAKNEEQLSRIRGRLLDFSLTAYELKDLLYRFLDVPFLPGYGRKL